MPGKVNPVIPEAVAMVAADVIGNDVAISIGAQSGNFQLNVMLPLIAYNLLKSINILSGGMEVLASKAIKTFKVNQKSIQASLDKNPILVTALNPIIGYAKAAAIAKKAHKNGTTLKHEVLKAGLIKEKEYNKIMSPIQMTKPK